MANQTIHSLASSLNSKLTKHVLNIDQDATSNRGNIRGQLLYDESECIVNLIFTSTATASNSPSIFTTTSAYKPVNDCAMSCVDITGGITSAIRESIPCGFSTNGTIFLKEITADHAYAISGAFIRNS